MNNSMAKKLRREARRQAHKRDEKIFPELKKFINEQPFLTRIKIAGKVLAGHFVILFVFLIAAPAWARTCSLPLDCRATSWQCTTEFKTFASRQALLDWLNQNTPTNYEVIYATSTRVDIVYSECTPIETVCSDNLGFCTINAG